MHGLTVKGRVASIMWGYQTAGTLRDWTISPREGGGWSITAQVDDLHTFRASQRPLTCVAPHASGAWRWPILELEIAAGALTARLGPKESSHVTVRSP
jgi:hypothetical protein